MVKAITPILSGEPTYDQFSGTLKYLQKNTLYAVTQPRYLVALKDY